MMRFIYIYIFPEFKVCFLVLSKVYTDLCAINYDNTIMLTSIGTVIFEIFIKFQSIRFRTLHTFQEMRITCIIGYVALNFRIWRNSEENVSLVYKY